MSQITIQINTQPPADLDLLQGIFMASMFKSGFFGVMNVSPSRDTISLEFGSADEQRLETLKRTLADNGFEIVNNQL